jgi:Uma2 family endonuclease
MFHASSTISLIVLVMFSEDAVTPSLPSRCPSPQLIDELTHPLGKIRLGRLDQQMVVIVNGEPVLLPPTGDVPSRAGFNIASNLREFERQNPIGRAYPDNTGYKVNLPNRAFFSPDASFYTGKATGMKFLEGSPVFAAEVRSEYDYGPKAE